MAKCLCSNDLNRLITVQRLKSTATITASGQIDESDSSNWETAGTEWVQFLTQGSKEALTGDQLNANATHQITMRYSTTAAAYTALDRCVYAGRIFGFAGPPLNVNEQNQWVRIPLIESA